MYSYKYCIWKIALNTFGVAENIWKLTAGFFGIAEIPEAFPFIAKNVPEKAFQTHPETSVKIRDLLGFENLFGKNGPFTVHRFQKRKCVC